MDTSREQTLKAAVEDGTLTPKEAQAGAQSRQWTKPMRKALTMAFVAASVAIGTVAPMDHTQAGEQGTNNSLNALFAIAFGKGGSAMDKVVDGAVGIGAGHVARKAGGDETLQRAAAGGAVVFKDWWLNQRSGAGSQPAPRAERERSEGYAAAPQTRSVRFETEQGGPHWIVKDLGQDPQTGLYMSEICAKGAQRGMYECSQAAYQSKQDQIDGAVLREQANRGMSRI